MTLTPLRVITSAHQLASLASRLRRAGKRVGLVPTMGALHEGHLALVRRARRDTDVVIVTIFVNPLQFGPREDYARYPRTLQQDLRLARGAGVDIVFTPSRREIYPPGFQMRLRAGPLAARWEGAVRPGHFDGVVTVVAILCQLTQPTDAYVGQKDYQQARIIEQLIQDLRMPIRCHVCPTVREPDGLAMSSRNRSLSPQDRRRATALIHALRAARARIRAGARHAASLKRQMDATLRRSGVRVDYAAVTDAETLEPLTRARGRVALLVAARVGRTRLIDNLLVDVP